MVSHVPFGNEGMLLTSLGVQSAVTGTTGELVGSSPLHLRRGNWDVTTGQGAELTLG